MSEPKSKLPVLLFWVGLAVVAFIVFKLQNSGSGGAQEVAAIAAAPAVTDEMKQKAQMDALDIRSATPAGAYTQLFGRGLFEFVEGGKAHALTYFLNGPQKPYPPGVKFPLVVVLHDKPGDAHAAQYLISQYVRANYPAYVLVPELTKAKSWSSGQLKSGGFARDKAAQVNFGIYEATELAKYVAVQYPVDFKRIYVMGCSEGGVGAFAGALYYPEVYAAALSISGGWRASDAPNFGKLPLWAIHGDKDRAIKKDMSSGIINALQKRRHKNVFYTEVPGFGLDCDNASLYNAATWNWLFNQKKR